MWDWLKNKMGGKMNVTTLAERFAVSGQIAPQEVAELAAMGFTDVVCNRPDVEVAGGPDSAVIGAATMAAGLRFHYMPVSHGPMPQDHAEALRDLMVSSDARVLAYCRSGARSTALWTLAGSPGR